MSNSTHKIENNSKQKTRSASAVGGFFFFSFTVYKTATSTVSLLGSQLPVRSPAATDSLAVIAITGNSAVGLVVKL